MAITITVTLELWIFLDILFVIFDFGLIQFSVVLNKEILLMAKLSANK